MASVLLFVLLVLRRLSARDVGSRPLPTQGHGKSAGTMAKRLMEFAPTDGSSSPPSVIRAVSSARSPSIGDPSRTRDGH